MGRLPLLPRLPLVHASCVGSCIGGGSGGGGAEALQGAQLTGASCVQLKAFSLPSPELAPQLRQMAFGLLSKRQISEFLITWFHFAGKRNVNGEPQAEATVLQKVTEESSILHHVPIWRAVSTLTSGVENFIVEKFVGAAAKTMRSWHVFVQIVWQSQM